MIGFGLLALVVFPLVLLGARGVTRSDNYDDM